MRTQEILGLDEQQQQILASLQRMETSGLRETLEMLKPVLANVGISKLSRCVELLVSTVTETGADASTITYIANLMDAAKHGEILEKSPIRVMRYDNEITSPVFCGGILIKKARDLAIYLPSMSASYTLMRQGVLANWHTSPEDIAEHIWEVALNVNAPFASDIYNHAKVPVSDCLTIGDFKC